MKIDFYLRYHTNFGQNLYINGNLTALGNNDLSHALLMNFLNDEVWTASIDIDASKETSFTYRYLLINEKGETLMDGEKHRTINLEKTEASHIIIIDTWNNAGEYENAFYTAPFTEVLLKESKAPKSKKEVFHTHTFKIKAPLLSEDECVCLLGSDSALNNWGLDNPVLLQKEKDWWVARVDLTAAYLPLAYKYGVYNFKKEQFVRFENGDNRLLYFAGTGPSETILHDGFIYLPNNTFKGAGVAMPVFSLRTKDSFGIGEFTDIELLVDWAVNTGLKLIQLLPVNDTTATYTWKDSYPYAAISAFALHPIYINLEKVAGKKQSSVLKPFSKKKKELNEKTEVDYEMVLNAKLNILREIFEGQGGDFLQEDDYKKFFDANAHWLMSYAAFSYLRDKYQTSEFQKWTTHSVYHEEEIKQLCSSKSKAFKEISFWYFVQYHLHCQLKEAVKYAHKKGVVLKGDIPIGIYRYGCDAWAHPELYNLDQQAGAPPDDFSIKGQNWGFPTYNWHQMQLNHFEWWRQRFHQMSHYFDTFRIDHILGFFRIWSVPVDEVEGIMGRFVPALPVHKNEFGERGIWFDYDRFCKPFINHEIVQEVFQDQAEMVKNTFLQPNHQGQFILKEPFNTQRKVEQFFAMQELTAENKKIKQGLFDLISNVMVFEQPGSNGELFHFRISMERTSSFQYLEDKYKHNLYELYVNYFYRRQDDFWEKEAFTKLPALKNATNMLICGEDLGMVPHCVPDVMQALGILSLEIQRMPKDPAKEFFHPKDAPYLSVVTPSSHDMSTIRGWWEEDRVKIQKFYHTILGEEGSAPFFCEPWINRAIVLQHLYSPAMWCIFQLQDWLGMSGDLRRDNPHEERINEPSNPTHYWRYRMHLTLEDLLDEKEFTKEVLEYVTKSGR